jgi:hypothetical protein
VKNALDVSASQASPYSLILAVGAGWVSVLLFLLPGEGVLPAEIASVTSFFLAQAIFPRCRMTLSPLVTPLNWLQFAFLLQLVVMPVTVRLSGFAQTAFLPYQPTVLADNVALLLTTLAYWSFCIAVHCKTIRSQRTLAPNLTLRWPMSTFLIYLFATLGILGLVARYKNPSTFIHAFTDPALYKAETSRNGASASLVDAVGDLFSSFFGTSIVMLWCKRLEIGLRTGRPGRFSGPVLVIAAALAFAMIGYNRAAIVFPLVAMSAVIGMRAPRQLLRNFVVIVALIVSLVTATVIYRFSAHPEDSGSGPSIDVLSGIDYMEFFQLYGQAPQYLAIVLNDSHYGLQPSFGRISIASIFSQIPLVGKSLRPLSGHSYYAGLTGHPDENPSFVGEVFLDFNVLGVIAAFLLIGYATAVLQQKVLTATHAFEVYVFQMIGIYLVASVLISVDVLGQFFVFYMFPFYFYFAFRAWRRRIDKPTD